LGIIGRYSPEIIAEALITFMETKDGYNDFFRIPEDLLREIDRYIKETKLDRSSYLREVLQKGFALDKQERLLMKYQRGRQAGQMFVGNCPGRPGNFSSS